MAIVLATQNRFYAAREPSYGKAAAVGAENRLAGLSLDVRQEFDTPRRRDKTGSRTWQGPPSGRRKRTEFSLTTYLQTNVAPGSPPAVGPLMEAAMGGAPLIFSGASVGGGSGPLQLSFSGSHGLKRGQGVVFKQEIRFVQRVVSSSAVELNAPFTVAPQSG